VNGFHGELTPYIASGITILIATAVVAGSLFSLLSAARPVCVELSEQLPAALYVASVEEGLWARVLLPRLGALREVLVAPPSSPLFELDDNWFHNPAAWQTMLSALDRLAATMRERGSCAVLLIHPQLHYLNALHPYHRHYDAIARAAAERGFHVVNPIDDFLGRKDRRLWVADDDPHPGPEAHAMLAARLLRELSALPAGCGLPTADPSLPPAASSLPPAEPSLPLATGPPARG